MIVYELSTPTLTFLASIPIKRKEEERYMVSNDKSICQNCGSKLKRYDKVSRIVRTKGGKTSWIEIERFRCPVCGQIHRELPDYIFPYKQYEAEVIRGVVEGFITCETYGYEDYPCEMTMIRWRNSQELQLLL